MYDLLDDIEMFLGEHGFLSAIATAAIIITAVYHLTH